MNPMIVSPLQGCGDGGKKALRVLFAHASARVRGIVFEVFQQMRDVVSETTCTDGLEALVLGEDLHPDLVLLGEHLSGMSARDVAWRLSTMDPRVRVVLISNADPSQGTPATSGGVSCILKADDLEETLPTLLEGEVQSRVSASSDTETRES